MTVHQPVAQAHPPGFSRTEDPGDRLARLKAEFLGDPTDERKERMVQALHRYWWALNSGSSVGLPEEVEAMEKAADRAIEERAKTP